MCPLASAAHSFFCNDDSVHTMYLPQARATEPMKFKLLGLPPQDLLSSLAVELRRAGYDYEEVFQRCTGVSNEWNWNPTNSSNVDERFCTSISERGVSR